MNRIERPPHVVAAGWRGSRYPDPFQDFGGIIVIGSAGFAFCILSASGYTEAYSLTPEGVRAQLPKLVLPERLAEMAKAGDIDARPAMKELERYLPRR